MVVQGGQDVAFLNGGAYEYGTNKVAVNYGNLLTGSFTRGATGSFTSSVGSWDDSTPVIPALNPTPFSPGLGAGTQINAFSRNDGYAPYAQQWNVNIQRELPYNMFITAAYAGNRLIHLPSQNNRIDQLDPKYDAQFGSQLADVFQPGQTSRPARNSSVGLSTASYTRARDYFVGKIPVAQIYPQDAFTTVNQYTISDIQRNYPELRNPPLYLENLNAKKNFYIGERWKAILSVDYFNAFNRTQFKGPDTNASDGTFGQVTQQGSQISNRQGQVSFRIEF